MESTKVEVKAEKIRRRNRLESDILRHFFEGLFYFTPLFGAAYACWRAARLRSIIFETKMDVRSLVHDLGGYEYLFQLRELKGYYGSYEHIKELLDERRLIYRQLEEYRKLNITEDELESIKLLRTYGALEIIPKKLLVLGESEREIGELKTKNLDLHREHTRLLNDIEDLRKQLKTSEVKINNIFVDIGGPEFIPYIKSLRDEYGSFESIREKIEELSSIKESFSKTTNISKEEMEVIGKLQKYGNPEIIVEKLHELDDLKYELSEAKGKEEVMEKYNEKLLRELDKSTDEVKKLKDELNQFYVDIGGVEFVPQIKKLKNEYGSFKAIEERIEELSRSQPKSSNLSKDEANFILKLKSFGSPDLIIERLKELEHVKHELTESRGKEIHSEKYNHKLIKELDHYKKEVEKSHNQLKKLTDELNQFYIDIGGAEFIPQIKSLKNEYGSFKAIREKIEALSSIKIPTGSTSKLSPEDMKAIKQLKDELSNIKKKDTGTQKYNEQLTKELEDYKKQLSNAQKDLHKSNEELSQFYIDIGGKEFIPQIKSLKNEYGSFKAIREKIEALSSIKIPTGSTSKLSPEDMKAIKQLKDELSNIKKKDTGTQKYNEQLTKELEDYKKQLSNAQKDLQKSNEELSQFYIDIGGKEFIPKIKKLRDGYGSFDKIKELLDKQEDLEKQLLESKKSKESTSEDLKMIQQLKKYGSVPIIIERITEYDKSKKELSDLKAQKDNWEKNNKKLLDEISHLKKELEDKEIRLQKVFIDIGGKNLIKETKN